MELRLMIEIAAKKEGSIRNLAKVLGVTDSNLTSAKMGRRGLPAMACGKLAEILGIDRWTVIAASELVTEKNEEKRAYFSPFVLNSLASLATAVGAASLALSPNDSHAANDTCKVSSPAPDTKPSMESMDGPINIM
jgi:hypothetical protein